MKGTSKKDSTLSAVIAKFGPVINLEENPEILIELIRLIRFLDDDGDGGLPPGGAPTPPPPPQTDVAGGQVTLGEVMKAVLQLNRAMVGLNKELVAIRGALAGRAGE